MHTENEAYLAREIERLQNMRLHSGTLIFQGSEFPVVVTFEESPDGPGVQVFEIKNGNYHVLPRVYEPVKSKKQKGRK